MSRQMIDLASAGAMLGVDLTTGSGLSQTRRMREWQVLNVEDFYDFLEFSTILADPRDVRVNQLLQSAGFHLTTVQLPASGQVDMTVPVLSSNEFAQRGVYLSTILGYTDARRVLNAISIFQAGFERLTAQDKAMAAALKATMEASGVSKVPAGQETMLIKLIRTATAGINLVAQTPQPVKEGQIVICLQPSNTPAASWNIAEAVQNHFGLGFRNMAANVPGLDVTAAAGLLLGHKAPANEPAVRIPRAPGAAPTAPLAASTVPTEAEANVEDLRRQLAEAQAKLAEKANVGENPPVNDTPPAADAITEGGTPTVAESTVMEGAAGNDAQTNKSK